MNRQAAERLQQSRSGPLLELTGVTRTFTRIERLNPVSDAELQNPAAGEWINPRHNLASWGYSPLDQLNTQNTHLLELAWVWGLEDGLRGPPERL